ncbi:MAG: ATP-binding protein [Verrucomicrobia bacterium]|nr:ATP-binding protein [Verrucomicrobiota bacterium]
MGTERQSRFRLSFQTKILIPVLTFLVLLPVITVFVLEQHVESAARQEDRKTLFAVSAGFRNSLDLIEKSLVMRFRDTVNEPRFKAVAMLNDPDTMHSFLVNSLEKYEGDVQVIIFTPNDPSQIPSRAQTTNIKDLSDFESNASRLIRQAKDGTTRSKLSVYDNRAYHLIATPVFLAENTDPVGILTFAVELGQTAVDDIKSLTRTEIVIYAGEQWITGTVDKDVFSRQSTVLKQSINYQDSEIATDAINGEHFHILTGRLENLEFATQSLSYALLSSYEERLQALSATKVILIGISVVGIAISICTIMILVRNLTRPLRQLRDGAEAVGRGDFSQEINIGSRDECGDLAKTFNQMTSNLKTSRDQLEDTVVELKKTQNQLIQREALLRENEEGLRLIIEGARDHVIFTINDNGEILRWNGAAERMLGYKTDEAKEINYIVFFAEEDKATGAYKSLINTAKINGRSEFEGWRIGKDGKRFWADVTLSRLETLPGEQTGGYVEIARDISARKKAETALVEARNAAENSNRAKNEFMGNMSHEIRTPMNGVIGMTSLLLEEKLSEEQRELADTIKNSADSLLEIIDDILDISKIEAGQLEIILGPVNVIELLEVTVNSFAHVFVEKDLCINIFTTKDVPAFIESDGSRIRQVLSNLIGNAVKFTEEGGVRIDMEYSKETKELCISVHDSGIGIPTDKIDQLFKPFFQVESNNSRRFGGTGLGLSISRKIIRLLNGDISIQSVLGKGSTFTVKMKCTPMEDTVVFRSFPQKKCTVLSNNSISNSAIVDQLSNWSVLSQAKDLTRENIIQALQDDSIDLLIIDDEENLIEIDSLMIGIEKVTCPIIRLLAINVKAESTWKGNCLTLNKPIHPTDLNGCLCNLIAKKDPVKLNKSTEPTGGSELNPSFAIQYPHSILIVEDNPINAKVMETILKKLGYASDVANNGEECLDAIELKPYDIIFMDLQMPIMDGYQATVRILNSETKKHPIYITAFTANARQDDRDACEAVGMHDFVAKPARPKGITDVIIRAHKWLEKQVVIEAGKSK